MRTITLALILHNQPNTVRPTYALTVHDKQQDDLQVRPLFSVSLQRPNVVTRLLTVWPMGIQVGGLVLRTGYVCAGENAVDDKVRVYWHPGPRQNAIEYFHGLFGPKWSVRLDGVLGYFTTKPNGIPGSGLGTEMADAVVFLLGKVPSSPTWVGDSTGALKSEMLAKTQPFDGPFKQGAGYAEWGVEPGAIFGWMQRAASLGVSWDTIVDEVRRTQGMRQALEWKTKEAPGKEPVSDAPATPENTGTKHPDTAFERDFGPRLRAQLRVKLISRFGITEEGQRAGREWLTRVGIFVASQEPPGSYLFEKLTAREAEKALATFDAEERSKARNKNPS